MRFMYYNPQTTTEKQHKRYDQTGNGLTVWNTKNYSIQRKEGKGRTEQENSEETSRTLMKWQT